MQKYRRSIARSFLVAALFAFIFAAAHPLITRAGTPTQVLYLGKLTNASGNAVQDGTYQMKFALYNSDTVDGDCLWSAGVVLGSDTGCADGASTRKSISVAVANGFFSVNLGANEDASGNDAQTFPTNIFDTNFYNLYLGVTICGTGSTQLTTCTGDESEMTPRKEISAAPFAMRSDYAERSNGSFAVGSSLSTTTSAAIGTSLTTGTTLAVGSSLSTTTSAAIGTSLTTGTTLTVGTSLGIGGAPTAGLTLAADKDILGTGTASFAGTAIATAGVSSLGSKIIWNPTKGGFRAGSVGDMTAIAGFTNGTAYWDTANVGPGSFAAGVNTKATGAASSAFGIETTAVGLGSAAFGMLSVAGDEAADETAFAAGFQATASANNSIALGGSVTASANQSIAIGYDDLAATADTAIAIGKGFTNSTANSIKLGLDATPELTVTSGTVDVTGSFTVNGSAVASALSGLTDATGINTINNSSYQQTWRWALSGADPIGMWFTESTASTGTGTPTLISMSTLAGSTAIPLYITNAGDAHSLHIGDASADESPFVIDENGQVGIGTNDPSSALSITKDKDKGATSGTEYPVLDITGSLTAAEGQTQTSFYGILSKPQANIGTGTLTNMYGMYIQNMLTGSQSPTIGTMYGLYIANYGSVGAGGGSPTVGTKYALVTETNAGSAVFSDSVAIGFTGVPSYDLSLKKSGATIGMERQTSGAGGALTISAGGAQSGATNYAGGDIAISAGVSTGSGTSAIRFKTASGASGTADRTPSTKMTILGSGNVGIGTTNPVTADLEVDANDVVTTSSDSEIGIFSNRTFTGTLTENAGTLWGISGYVDSQVNANGFPVVIGGTKGHVQVTANPTGITNVYGTQGSVANTLTSGTLPAARGLYGSASNAGVGGTITAAYGVYGESVEDAGTITTGYGGYFTSTNATTNVGLYATASGGDNNYAAIFAAGNVGIGATSPTSLLVVGDGTNTTAANGISFGDATGNLYRSAASTIRTDGAFLSQGMISAGASGVGAFGSFRSWDQGAGVWTFGRDNVSTGNFVIAAGGSSTVFSLTSAGLATFTNYVTVKATVASSTAGLCWSGTEGAARIEDCNGAPSDLAEWYETESSVSEGDLVALGTQTINYRGIKRDATNFQKIIEGEDESVPVMVKSSKPYQSNITGVISTAPYQVLGEDLKKSSLHPLPLALAGRVPVKVTTENGAIAPGDYLTSSSTPGAAMKATQSGPTVGMALESFDSKGVGKILMLVNLTHISGASVLTTATPAPVSGSATEPSRAKNDPSAVRVPASSGTPTIISGRAELSDAASEVNIALPAAFASSTAGNYTAFITSTTTPAALFIAGQGSESFVVRSMDGVSFGPFNWMAIASENSGATTSQQEITPDAASSFENIPITPGALTPPDGPLSDVLDSAPVQATNDLIPPIAVASFAGFLVSSGIMVRSAGRKKGLRGYLQSFLYLPAVLTKHSAQGFSRMASPNETGIIDHSYTRFARWHFASQVLLLVGVNLLLVRAILGVAIKAL